MINLYNKVKFQPTYIIMLSKSKSKIFLIDDDPLEIEVLQRILVEFDYEIAGIAYNLPENYSPFYPGFADLVLVSITIAEKEDFFARLKLLKIKYSFP